MNCIKCITELPQGKLFCSTCGTVNKEIVKEMVDERRNDEDIASELLLSHERKKKFRIYFALAIPPVIIVLWILLSDSVNSIANKQATSVYKQQRNIALVKAPPSLDVFNFNNEFKIKTKDYSDSYVKMKLSFGTEKGQPALSAELYEKEKQMENIIFRIISQKPKDELKTISDQLDLREEIKAHVNHILTNGKIKEVYFREFIIF